MKTSDPTSESGEKPNYASLGVQMSFSASVAALCLLSGFFALHNPIHLFNKDSVLNMYKQTRTMHYTTNPHAQQWTSLLTTVPYNENLTPGNELIRYRVMAGFFPKTNEPVSASMFINGQSWGILSSFAPNVYFSALAFIYTMFFLQMFLSANVKMKGARPFVFAAIVVFWVFECNWIVFSQYREFDWHSSLKVCYNVEGSGISVIYAGAVLCIYTLHLCVKEGVCNSIFGPTTHSKANGPLQDTEMLVAVTIFMASCGLIGMCKAVVLETEAQLALSCAVAIAAIEYFCAHVCAFFQYAQAEFMTSTEETDFSQVIFFCRLTRLVKVLVLAINISLFAILFTAIQSLRPMEMPNLWLFFLIVGVIYLALKCVAVAFEFPKIDTPVGATAPTSGSYAEDAELTPVETFNAWNGRKTIHKQQTSMVLVFYVTFMIGIFAVLLVVSLFVHDNSSNSLRNAEKYQYMSLDHSRTISKCALGVQTNSIFSNLKPDTACLVASGRNTVWKMESNSPIDLKVYAWTRWWRPVMKISTCMDDRCQDIDTFFCSVGFESHYGRCTAEYNRITTGSDKGRYLPKAWREAIKTTLTIAPTLVI